MEDGGYRTHQRVECFVKRHLGQEVCNSLRISEPCIVVGGSYSHAFKFIVLTDDTLFIFANPPQAENDIEMRIDLQQISEVKYVCLHLFTFQLFQTFFIFHYEIPTNILEKFPFS